MTEMEKYIYIRTRTIYINFHNLCSLCEQFLILLNKFQSTAKEK